MAENKKKENWFSRLMHKLGTKLAEPEATVDAAAENPKVAETLNVVEKPRVVKKTEENEKVENNGKSESVVNESEDKESLINGIFKTLSNLLEEKDYTKDKKLVIWLDTDQISFDSYNTDSYKQALLNDVVNEHGYFFDDATFCIGLPDAKLHATKIFNSKIGYMQIVSKETEAVQAHSKAKICVVGEFGSLVENEYILSLDDMQNRHITAYNIGAGRFPQLKSGFRENHIAIDDNPNSPMAEKNKYVSRMHAHIGYSDRFGFYLQAEIDGTRMMGKRTRIFRGNEVIECDSPKVKNYLKGTDIIELGKAVKLQYVELD